MKKVILNKCFGGFDVSKEAYMLYAKKKGLTLYLYESEFINRKFIYKKVMMIILYLDIILLKIWEIM